MTWMRKTIAPAAMTGALAALLMSCGNDGRQVSVPSTPPVQGVPYAQPPGGTVATGMQVDVAGLLAAHNRLRARHGVPPLTWSPTLQQSSQEWADRCVFEHSGSGNGENLAGWSGTNRTQASRVDAWYGEIRDYDFRNRPVPYVASSGPTGHFTQVVWRGTTQVGCGVARCPNDPQMFLACQYSPPGNFRGRHAANVLPPR